jgi:hypothetical protein
MSADMKINITIKITILVQISNLYVKQQERTSNDINNINSRSDNIKIQFGIRNHTKKIKKVGQMISIISKVGHLISKFILASEITPKVHFSSLYIKKQQECICEKRYATALILQK